MMDCGLAREFASLQQDKGVVLAAVAENAPYASSALQQDKDVAFAAVKQCGLT